MHVLDQLHFQTCPSVSALNIYTAVQNFKKCTDAYDESKSAVTELRKANATLQAVYANAVEARAVMFQVT
jgi:hypothetical protein